MPRCTSNTHLLILLSLELKYCALMCYLLKSVIKHVSARMLQLKVAKPPTQTAGNGIILIPKKKGTMNIWKQPAVLATQGHMLLYSGPVYTECLWGALWCFFLGKPQKTHFMSHWLKLGLVPVLSSLTVGECVWEMVSADSSLLDWRWGWFP